MSLQYSYYNIRTVTWTLHARCKAVKDGWIAILSEEIVHTFNTITCRVIPTSIFAVSLSLVVHVVRSSSDKMYTKAVAVGRMGIFYKSICFYFHNNCRKSQYHLKFVWTDFDAVWSSESSVTSSNRIWRHIIDASIADNTGNLVNRYRIAVSIYFIIWKLTSIKKSVDTNVWVCNYVYLWNA